MGKQILPPTLRGTKLTKIEFREGGGIYTYTEHSNVPIKGFMVHEALEAADIIKKELKHWAKVLGSWPTRYLAGILFLFPSRWFFGIANIWLYGFADLSFHVIKYVSDLASQSANIRVGQDDKGKDLFVYRLPDETFEGDSRILFKREAYSTMVRHLYDVMTELYGDTYQGKTIRDVLCLILEHDMAYRHRVQDLLGEMSKEAMLKNPAKEARRIFKELSKRDKARQWKDIGSLVYLLLFIRRDIRKELQRFVERLEMYEVVPDGIDTFWMCQVKEYDFMGQSYEDRQELSKKMIVTDKGDVIIQSGNPA